MKSLTVFQTVTQQSFSAANIRSNEHIEDRSSALVAPKVNLDKLAELENNELSELVKLYMTENHHLRHENNELYSARDTLLRDQELVCRENERLLKKLEDVNSVCCRSPLIPARPAISGDIFNFSTTGSENNDFFNGSEKNSSSENVNGRISSADNNFSKSMQEEIEKLRISQR